MLPLQGGKVLIPDQGTKTLHARRQKKIFTFTPWEHRMSTFTLTPAPKSGFRTQSLISSLLLSFLISAAAAAKSRQSCPTLCNPIGGSPPGSAVPGILQARTLEWVAILFSSA